MVGTADLTKVSLIYFIVEGANKTGTVYIDDIKTSTSVLPDPTKTSSDLNLPQQGLNIPGATSVSPTGAESTVTRTGTGISFTYATTSTNAWAGAGFSYPAATPRT